MSHSNGEGLGRSLFRAPDGASYIRIFLLVSSLFLLWGRIVRPHAIQ